MNDKKNDRKPFSLNEIEREKTSSKRDRYILETTSGIKKKEKPFPLLALRQKKRLQTKRANQIRKCHNLREKKHQEGQDDKSQLPLVVCDFTTKQVYWSSLERSITGPTTADQNNLIPGVRRKRKHKGQPYRN